ncbi:SIN3-HDAC complex-associated factor [Diachasma alloeum]|uniref:SIN3-HDAC complex-associated factor n=1 Tax=Diachasma alloeum TaxID=454923 RepID=UPI000738392F|nr:SIN3-HDAC complex-associated factor [Diachasma alloeum]XP_015116074.1 SIN3-HDAC complex-associated factor [Diachasma alloeum]
MFSFHKPKVYRSTTGCCICKAKSSSSRFTDSKRYEEDFFPCFLLEERRTGEICNACVLLVKRWKKLPAGSNRNWSHVVDARAGPGIKSLTKFKSKNKKKLKENMEKLSRKKTANKQDEDREQSPAMSDDLNDEEMTGTGSKGSSRAGSPEGSDDTMITDKRLNDTDCNEEKDDYNGFIDMAYFKRERICCGEIFRGLYGEIIVDPSLIKRCAGCLARQRRQREANVPANTSPFHSSAAASPAHSAASSSPSHSVDSSSEASKTTGKIFSDSSSDSGYDESSNPGIGESKIIKSCSNSIVTSIKVHQIKAIQLKAAALSETVRLTSDVPIKLVPIKQVEKFTCKPLSTLVTSSGAPLPIAVPNNPLVDFAIHATRQSVTN